MTLRELATTETTALVDRLIAAMTEELDAATTRLQADADAAVEQVRTQLTGAMAAAERAEASREQAERARESDASRAAALERELEAARRAIEEVRAEAAADVAKLQADAKAKLDALAETAAKERAAVEGEARELRSAAAKRQAEAEEKIAALTAAAKKLEADAADQIESITATAARQQAEARAKIEAVMATASKMQAEAQEKLAAALDAAAKQHADAQARVEAAKASAARIEAEASSKIAAASGSAQQLAEIRQKAETATREREQIAASLNDTQKRLETVVTERDKIAASLTDAQKRIDAAVADRDKIASELQRSEADRVQQARAMRDQVLQLASLPMDRLRTGFYRLTTAPSVAEALTALVETVGSEFSRAALFQVTGNRLQGVHQVGFDFDSDISKIVVPLTRESPLTDAVRSGRVQGLTANELTASSRTLFGGSPGFVLVLPIAICGEISAVIYADDSEDPEAEYSTPERRVKFAEVLLWHAVPLLARLSIEENTRAELREYAIQLFTDLERAYAADTTTAPSVEKLRGHLEHNLEYARQMFAQQAEGCGRLAAGLFDEQLEALIKSQGTTPFVRDLAAVAHMTVVKPAAKNRKHS
jgi:hypothetical protein